jgi:phenylalanyl-tRNA synthetase alpha chain
MEIQKIISSLSPNERKIIPYLKEKEIADICKKSNLDKTSVTRALGYLENKGALKIDLIKEKIIEIGINGALYKKKGLPERRLLNKLVEKRIIPLDEAKKQAELSDDEFKASIGVLKKKAMIELKNNKIVLSASKEEISKKSPEEIFLESLPLDYEKLSPEQNYSFKNLQSRKEIIQIKEYKKAKTSLTKIGEELIKTKINEGNLIETINSDTLKKETNWKNKKFRRYDVTSHVPEIYGGKKHFVNQAIEYAKKIWTDMGFEEMTGPVIQSSFWNFDALFTAQDHPVREMQDTFFINKKIELSQKDLIKKVKESHEKGVGDSTGWKYSWNEEEAKRLVLRTHTTGLSAKALSNLKSKDLPKKFFVISKCFRNETIDWSHGFEFNQTDGIVVDKNANFRNLLGYLKQFFSKMGLEKIRFSPAYFPYTEPSVEIHVWHEEKKIWLELGGAGILRPEVTIPLLGEPIPVLAWGPGFDRIIMDYYQIKDLRELYKNDITKLRKTKFWMK